MQDAVDKTLTIWIDRRRPSAAIAACAVGAAVVMAALPARTWAVDSETSLRSVAGSGQVEVCLRPTAVVTGPRVRLADVADVTGTGAADAGRWVVATAPPAGGTRILAMKVIQRALADRGINLADWRFHGASRCHISRPATVPSPAHKTLCANDRNTDGLKGASGFAKLVASGDEARAAGGDPAGPDTLEATLRRHLAERLADLGGEPVIQFSPMIRQALALSAPTYRFEITNRNNRRLGLVSLEVQVYEQGRRHGTLSVLAQVSLRKRVAVAARPINRRQTIKAADLKMVERLYDRADRAAAGVSDASLLVGRRARRFITPDEPISLQDVEAVPLVKRNELVTVWVRRGGIVIKAVGKATRDAGLGEIVLLKNEMSGQTFAARVTGPRTAELAALSASEGGVRVAQRREKP